MNTRSAIHALPLTMFVADQAIVAGTLAPLGWHAMLAASLLPFGLIVADWMDIVRARGLTVPLCRLWLRGAALIAVGSVLADFARVDRNALVAHLAASLACLLLIRLLAGAGCRVAERRGLARERIAILGMSPVAERLARRLSRPGLRGLAVAGCWPDTPDGITALLQLGRDNAVDRVLLALPAGDEARIRRVVWQLKALDVPVEQYASLNEADWADTPLGRLDDVPVARLLERAIPSWGRAVKSGGDKLLSAALLVAVLPVLAGVVIAIRLDSPGPVLFRQFREGRNGAAFEILKFRTMTWQPTPTDGLVWQTTRQDCRVTRVGRFLRATSLDELPQLINVLRGEMSVVGPRPHPLTMMTEDRLSTEITADYPQRHRVKPGMTGWAQVNGSRGGLASADDLCRRVRYDLEYIENWSPLLDLKIALLTPLKLIFHGGSAF